MLKVALLLSSGLGYTELAERLAAAFVSERMGIGMEYARKRYIYGEVPEFWLKLAEALIDMERQFVEEESRRFAEATEKLSQNPS